jgi:hypothetical protein
MPMMKIAVRASKPRRDSFLSPPCSGYGETRAAFLACEDLSPGRMARKSLSSFSFRKALKAKRRHPISILEGEGERN